MCWRAVGVSCSPAPAALAALRLQRASSLSSARWSACGSRTTFTPCSGRRSRLGSLASATPRSWCRSVTLQVRNVPLQARWNAAPDAPERLGDRSRLTDSLLYPLQASRPSYSQCAPRGALKPIEGRRSACPAKSGAQRAARAAHLSPPSFGRATRRTCGTRRRARGSRRTEPPAGPTNPAVSPSDVPSRPNPRARGRFPGMCTRGIAPQAAAQQAGAEALRTLPLAIRVLGTHHDCEPPAALPHRRPCARPRPRGPNCRPNRCGSPRRPPPGPTPRSPRPSAAPQARTCSPRRS